MSMYPLPSWSDTATNSIGLFYRGIQSIEIYVEDLGSEALYTKLFSRAVNNEIKIRKIVPLGGRTKVVEMCKKYNEDFPALFVIDGDLDLLHGEREGAIEKLFQHRMYCMENYLFCEKASSAILQETLGNILEEDAYAKLDWNSLTSEMSDKLLELFKIYAVSWKVCPEEKTISTGYYNLCEEIKKKSHFLCDEKIEVLILKLKNKIFDVINESEYNEIYSNVSENIEALSNPLYAVSGKDYLLNALRDHLYRKGANLRNDDGFKFRLAQHCNIEPLAELKEAIKSTVRGENYIQEAG